MKHTILAVITLAFALTFGSSATAWGDDPLPSWNDGDTRQSIIAFVKKVTQKDSDSFVPVDERIAVFDNDGTLWTENPLPNEAVFAFSEIERMLPAHPEWNDDPAVQALQKHDIAALLADNHKGLFKIIALTHAGMSPDDFDKRVSDWLPTAKDKRFDRHYNELIYQPMLELLTYLRANDFQTWIVSGGGQDFMRVFAQNTYGIPPQQVIGSHALVKFEMIDGKPTLTKTMDGIFIDDKDGKPVGIHQFIGRRPIASFGNSDGDQAMLEYTTINNPLPSFGLIVHHTDAEREYAYDANPKSSGKLVTALAAAPRYGWTVVDMKADWKTVFPATK